MNYHIISTGRGTGAIFTNKIDAMAFHKAHPGSTLSTVDRLPDRIPGRVGVGDLVTDDGPSNRKNFVPLTVYTDGSAIGNPGPGGYGVVMADPDGITSELSQVHLHDQ